MKNDNNFDKTQTTTQEEKRIKVLCPFLALVIGK
jgi:hypothetical protein